MGNVTSKASTHVRDRLERARAALVKEPETAVRQAKEIIGSHPEDPQAHRLLARALRQLGRHEEAGQAEADAVQASARTPLLLRAAQAMRERQVETAERLVRSYLKTDPDDPQALRMLAEIAAVCGHGGDAERLLHKALDQAPGFVPLYVNLATLLHDLGCTDEAIALMDQVLASEPENGMVLSFRAEILISARRLDEALETYEKLLACASDIAIGWMNYGHVLNAVGRIDEAIAAFRKSLELNPASGFAWWGLANLRTIKFDGQDVAAMEKALADSGDDLDRVQLHFALGRAFDDQDRFEEAFNHYTVGNEIRRTLVSYDPGLVEETVRKARALFTREFLCRHADQGYAATDPIFIVGLPRSGSTLVEQILASHPSVEGVGEVFDIERIAIGIAGREAGEPLWLDAVGQMDIGTLRALGETYIDSTRIYRKTDCPFFTDKMPFNWRYSGLLHLILPNAKIVDVRRHPLGCCFSNFALYFNRATHFASNLEDLGRYYRAYVRMMDHFDRVLPSRIHRVLYEDLIENPEGEVRRLLDHLGLPFHEDCLRHYKNPRPVQTPSAQQVRRPIYREALDRWQNYNPWLGPLETALGSVLDHYPHVPDEWPEW